jgi:hypothetical protein
MVSKQNKAHGEAFEDVIHPFLNDIYIKTKKLFPSRGNKPITFHNTKDLSKVGEKLHGYTIRLGRENVSLASVAVFDMYSSLYDIEIKNWNTFTYKVNYTDKTIIERGQSKPFPKVGDKTYGFIQEMKLTGNLSFKPLYYKNSVGDFKLYNIWCNYLKSDKKPIGWLYDGGNVNRDVILLYKFDDGTYSYKVNDKSSTTYQFDELEDIDYQDRKMPIQPIPLFEIALKESCFLKNEYALIDYNQFKKCHINK